MTTFRSASDAATGRVSASTPWSGPAHAMPKGIDGETAVVEPNHVAVARAAQPFYPGAVSVSSVGGSEVHRVPEAESVPYRWWQHMQVRPGARYRADLTWSEKGWPLIADDLWRIAHQDRSGARRADSRVIGLGLGAALLCELVLAGQIGLTADGLLLLAPEVVAALAAPDAVAARERFGAASILPDRIADELLAVIVAEAEPLPVETWLEYLASRSAAKVARRLLDAGHVKKTASRRRLRREVVYRPVDDMAAAWPAARLLIPLRQGAQPDDVDVVLLGLCRATGLHRWLFAGQPHDPVAALLQSADGLPHPFPLLWTRLDGLVSASASSLR